MHTYSQGCTFSTIEDIAGKHVTVMGLGLNGGGEACVRFFLKHGAFVTVTDMKTEEQLKPTIDSLNADKTLDLSRLTYILGAHREEDFKNADCVIKNPGVKIEGNKYLSLARAVESDISIFLHFTKSPVIAVTGSKGKSSTVSAINYGLNKAGYTAFLGGNITVSPLTFLEKTTEDTPVVLELSSWQLADLRGRKALRPYISLITKIVPDHQNWYGNMEDYVADKRLIYKDQDKGCYTIVDMDADEPGTGPASGGSWGDFFAKETKGTVLRYTRKNSLGGNYGVFQEKSDDGSFCGKVFLPGMDEPEVILRNLSVPGEHMRVNVLNAALVLFLMHVPSGDIAEILGSWQGIDHRLQFFHTYRNFKFYNDSCATVPEAAGAASQAFGKPVILITGGTDKGLSFEPLIETLSAKNGIIPVKKLYLLAGTGTDKLTKGLSERGIPYEKPYENLSALLSALKTDVDSGSEKESAGTEEIIVFSPGATSFGMFRNEFDRGNTFMAEVKKTFI